MSLGFDPLASSPLATIPSGNTSISASVAVTDGADVLAGSLSVLVAVSSATTDGADVLLANVDPVSTAVSVSSATTDGADVLAGSLSVIVAASSATTDGADVLASNLSPIVAASSAKTDGADVLASSVSPIVALSSATTDGADVLASAISPIVAVSSSVTDGADVLLANVEPVASSVDISVAVTDGADVIVAAISVANASQQGDGTPKKRQYIIRKGNKLLAYRTETDAREALVEKPKKQYPAKKGQKTNVEPIRSAPQIEREVSITAIQEVAALHHAQEQLNALLQQQQYEALVALYEQLQAQEAERIRNEEDEDFLLLMAA